MARPAVKGSRPSACLREGLLTLPTQSEYYTEGCLLNPGLKQKGFFGKISRNSFLVERESHVYALPRTQNHQLC